MPIYELAAAGGPVRPSLVLQNLLGWCSWRPSTTPLWLKRARLKSARSGEVVWAGGEVDHGRLLLRLLFAVRVARVDSLGMVWPSYGADVLWLPNDPCWKNFSPSWLLQSLALLHPSPLTSAC